jgi:ribosomal protein L10
MARADKVTAVAELTERFQSADGAVLTEYRGLTVAQLAELRGSLGDSATFTVVKNTLTKIAANEAGVAGQLGDMLSGPSAIAFVKGDVVEAAKGLRDFSRANPLLVIKGGVLDGKAISPGRDRAAGRTGAARGAAGQAGRRDEGLDVQGGRGDERAARADGPAGRRAAGQARSRGRCGRRGARQR